MRDQAAKKATRFETPGCRSSSCFDVQVHEASGDEREQWWERAVKAFPPYAEYQTKTEREIPVFIASPLPS
jgi:hypothetical protein